MSNISNELLPNTSSTPDPGHPQLPAPLPFMQYTMVHCYIVAVLGTTGNGLALWCTYQCQKTRPGVKVLLTGVFLPLLLICLVTRPVFAEFIRGHIMGDPTRVPVPVLMVFVLLYSSLALMEIFSIAVVAILRGLSVWCPGRHSLEVGPAVTIVVVIFVYSVASTIGLLGMVELRIVTDRIASLVMTSVYFFFNVMVPLLATLSSYAAMMIAVRRNKRRLASVQNSSRTSKTMDEATKAMLAVFVINLMLGLPHSIFHLLDKPSHFSSMVIHIIFSTHFVLDPIVFIWFNRNYRKRVGDLFLCGFTSFAGLCGHSFKRRNSHTSIPTSTTSPTASV